MKEKFSDFGIKKGIIFLLIGLFLVATASASQFFSVSNKISDEIDVVRENKRCSLTLSYESENELGGENKELKVGKWDEFQISLVNESPSTTLPWENIFVRIKFYGVSEENLSAGYKHEGSWRDAEVHDLRTLELGGTGAVADIGPEGGWSIGAQTERKYSLRIKIERVIENMKVEMEAITGESSLETERENLEDPKSRSVINPDLDTHVNQRKPGKNYEDEDHLELATEENGNSYILLNFPSENLPSKINSGELNLYQYWGSGFGDLRDSNVDIQVFSFPKKLREKEVSWESIHPLDNLSSNPISEKKIPGNGNWYTFDLTSYLNKIEPSNHFSLLLKFSQDNFDNHRRRIRFDSVEGEKSPYIIIF